MFKEITKYYGFTENAIKEQYAYKFRALIWVLYDFIFLFVEYFLWKAIFEANNGKLYDITLVQYINYIVMGLFVARLSRCNIDFDISSEIKNGNIVMNLLKPYSYIKMMFAKHIGYSTGNLINMIPVVIVIGFLIGFQPVSPIITIAFIISIALAFAISFFFSVVIGMMAFWVTNSWGLNMFKYNLFAIFAGQMISINLFFKIGENGIVNFPLAGIPDGLIQVFFKGLGYLAYMLPFQAMSYTPTAIYTGMIKGETTIILHLLLQLFWAVVLAVLIKIVWKNAQDKITIMGG